MGVHIWWQGACSTWADFFFYQKAGSWVFLAPGSMMRHVRCTQLCSFQQLRTPDTSVHLDNKAL